MGGASEIVDGQPPVVVRSYVSSVAYAPDGRTMLATMEGSQTVVAFSADDINETATGFSRFENPYAVSLGTDRGSVSPGPPTTTPWSGRSSIGAWKASRATSSPT